jgi:hypothetical protein
VKIPIEWLTERVEVAPTSYFGDVGPETALRSRMAWQRLKREAGADDELWAFANPSNTWKKQGRHTGYALVREGRVVLSVDTGG